MVYISIPDIWKVFLNTGERTPPFDVIVNLAKYYNVSIDYIAGLTNCKKMLKYEK